MTFQKNETPEPTAKSMQLADIIADIRVIHSDTSRGIWGKGLTTHHTVARRDGLPPYRIAEFHHARDAEFCDAAHAFMPQIMDAALWKPEFDAITRKQEQLAIEFVNEISLGRPDAVRLLEMAQALYEAEREDKFPSTTKVKAS